MFAITEINLGRIKVGSINTLNFPYDDLDYISRITTPCTCTGVTNYTREKVIRGEYRPNAIPVHLNVSEFPVSYTIAVEYMKDGHQFNQNLVFKAIIIE